MAGIKQFGRNKAWLGGALAILFACVLGGVTAFAAFGGQLTAGADEESETLTTVENHIIVTKDGSEDVGSLDNFTNQLTNNIELQDNGDGTYRVQSLPMVGKADDFASKHTIKTLVKLAGVGDGSTVDITDECTCVNPNRGIYDIPSKYFQNIKKGDLRPVVYTIIKTPTGEESDVTFYSEVYVSVNIDGKDVELTNQDPNVIEWSKDDPRLVQEYTIDGVKGFKFMNTQRVNLSNLNDAYIMKIPTNESPIFGGNEFYANYNIESVDVWAGNTMNKLASETGHKVDNTIGYYTVDTANSQITGLSSLGQQVIAVRVNATTKNVEETIVNPKLNGNAGEDSFSLVKVNGYEYSCDDGKTWQDSNTFTGLNSGTTYHVLQRPKGSSSHSQRLNVTTAGKSSSGEVPKPEWNPPFNVGDYLNGKVTISFLEWPSATATTFGVWGYVGDESQGGPYSVNCLGCCASPGFNCCQQTMDDVDISAQVTSIDKNTGTVTLSYFCNGRAKSMQNVVGTFTLQISVPGGVELWKKSSNETITNGNSCYTLEGAVYNIYSDSGCNNWVGQMTTNGDGYAYCGNLNAGTYWVREETAPSGYSKDGNVYETYVGAGCTTTVNGGTVYDTPQNDPVNILLQKTDSKTGATPQGSASLKGAQFTVRYYDTTDAWSISTDYATRVSAAKRTWVYETDENGKIWLQKQDPISGDEVFKSQDGNRRVFPLGTYVIEETKAPTGYLLPNYQKRTFIEVVTPNDNSSDESTGTYFTNGQSYHPDDLNWPAWKIDGEK